MATCKAGSCRRAGPPPHHLSVRCSLLSFRSQSFPASPTATLGRADDYNMCSQHSSHPAAPSCPRSSRGLGAYGRCATSFATFSQLHALRPLLSVRWVLARLHTRNCWVFRCVHRKRYQARTKSCRLAFAASRHVEYYRPVHSTCAMSSTSTARSASRILRPSLLQCK